MKFTIESESISSGQQVQPKGCNAIEFINIGDEVATVENIPVPVYAAGMQEYPRTGFFGMAGEVMHGTITVTFAGGGSAPGITIIRKYYQQNV